MAFIKALQKAIPSIRESSRLAANAAVPTWFHGACSKWFAYPPLRWIR